MGKNVLLATNVKITKLKIISVLEKKDVNIFEIEKTSQIFSKMKQNNGNCNLLIADLSIGPVIYEIIDQVKQFDKTIPIVLLSDTQNKEEFIKFIKIGISDFLIKPFTEQRLNKSFNKFLFNSKDLIKNENFNFTYENIMKFELKKSKKGKYPITFTLLHFSGANGSISANIFIKKMLSDLWDTDEIVFYKKNVLLGIFPFSGSENSKIIENKINAKFEEIKIQNQRLSKTEMAISIFVDSKDNSFEYDYYINEFNSFLKKEDIK